MKKALIAIAAIVLAINLHAQDLPMTQIKDVNSGKTVAFNETIAKNKVTLISFWGTWCAHGKREVKTMARKMADWKKQVDFNFMTIAEDQQHTENLVRPYVQAQGWSFPCYIDPNCDLKRLLNFNALPYTIIIDKKGKIVYTHTGYEAGGEIFTKLKALTEAK